MHQDVHENKNAVDVANQNTVKLNGILKALYIAVNFIARIHVVVVQRTYE